jgi:hypothetical protein
MWSETLSALTHGTSGLALAYGSVGLPLLAGLKHGGASARKWLLAPFAAIPATVAAGAAMAVVAAGLHGLGLGFGTGAETLLTATGLSVGASVGYATGRIYARSESTVIVHQRGAMVHEFTKAGRSVRAAHPGSERAITLGGIPLSLEDETKHFKIIGTTGTGKSTAIREILTGALARGDRAIIADPDGGYLTRFYDANRGDVILNPFDSRSVKWDVFGEMKTSYDVEQLARSLIPDQAGSDRSWTGYARTFFTAVTRRAQMAGVRDVGELYRLLVVAPAAELRILVAGTPAQPFLEEQNVRMFDSVRAVTSSAVGALNYIAQQQATDFSIRRWVATGAHRAPEGGSGPGAEGVLFIPYKAGQIAALRSTISAWMRVGIFEAMDQPEGDQRLWFVIDELDALGPIDGLKDALTRMRKFGGRGVLGFQTIAQVSSSYEREAQSIVENTGNTLILRSSGSEHGGTSQFASRLIGQREVLRTNISRSRRPSEFFSSTTHSQQVRIEAALLDAEIEQLPDLEGYLKIASVPSWQRVRLQHESQHASGSTATQGYQAADIREAAVRLWRRMTGERSGPDADRGPVHDAEKPDVLHRSPDLER